MTTQTIRVGIFHTYQETQPWTGEREHRDREHRKSRDMWGVGLTSILCVFTVPHCSRQHVAGPYYSSYIHTYI